MVKMRKILNYTPHNIQLIDEKTGKEIVSYPPEKISIRGKHVLGKQVDNIKDVIPIYDVGKYVADIDELKLLNLNPGDTVFVSTIGAEQMKDFALENKINVLIPGSGPGQCLRDEKGQIKGCFLVLKPY